MQRYMPIAMATIVAVGFVMASKLCASAAYAAGAYGKGAGLAKQPSKENRKKLEQKARKGDAARPVGP